MEIRSQLLTKGSKTSACASILGSWQLCHNLCLGIIGLLATLGITVSGMPLLFLNTWQLPIWLAAAGLFGAILGIRFGLRVRCISSRSILGTSGLLLAGLPFLFEGVESVRLAGLFVVSGALVWYLKDLIISRRGPQTVLDFVSQGRRIAGGFLGIAIIAGLMVLSVKALPTNGDTASAASTAHSQMKFTLFDVAEAKELMDKNGDGKCDTCGMAVDQCIESGMLECTMDPQGKIGLLGSEHVHAQFSVFIDGKPLDLTSYGHRMAGNDDGLTSSFIHVHTDDVTKLHRHARGVPLGLFFKSIKMAVDPTNIEATVNGGPIENPLEYVFQDGDVLEVRIKR